MIQYRLKCAQGHSFDSWFQSADAFDKLARAGMISCETCGSGDVSKAIMAPNVRPARNKAAPETAAPKPAPAPAPETKKPAPKTAPPKEIPPEIREQAQAALREMRDHVEKNSEYVGEDFAKEARAMHLGDAPERAIHGEADLQSAKDLIDDGIEIMPLPFTPKRKTN